ncbi:Qat anti-phage system TatD family nuclease QatD [Polaromonas sp. OV174]|uniref:Qat anti-phage system TatD family nuclease QatD n=1 Tax=Polaromonas sp. OV174 TaxID=1855300 RepID=UPI0021014046|nr:Qat anti-phage system TatD family nuclease QatD [Polaromonas sp. OV174]
MNDFTWLVTTSPRAYAATSKILPPASNLIVTPGLHPEVADTKASELELLLAQIDASVAVGEVGLDGSSRYKAHYAVQLRIFQAVVSCCQAKGGRVLSVHSRSAADAVLDTLRQYPGFGLAVMHWFTDSPASLRRASALGCWFSVGPAMLKSANGRNLVSLMPRERVVPESDGPFGAVMGKPVMPWETGQVTDTLAELWTLPVAEVAQTLNANGKRLIALMSN